MKWVVHARLKILWSGMAVRVQVPLGVQYSNHTIV